MVYIEPRVASAREIRLTGGFRQEFDGGWSCSGEDGCRYFLSALQADRFTEDELTEPTTVFACKVISREVVLVTSREMLTKEVVEPTEEATPLHSSPRNYPRGYELRL